MELSDVGSMRANLSVYDPPDSFTFTRDEKSTLKTIFENFAFQENNQIEDDEKIDYRRALIQISGHFSHIKQVLIEMDLDDNNKNNKKNQFLGQPLKNNLNALDMLVKRISKLEKDIKQNAKSQNDIKSLELLKKFIKFLEIQVSNYD